MADVASTQERIDAIDKELKQMRVRQSKLTNERIDLRRYITAMSYESYQAKVLTPTEYLPYLFTAERVITISPSSKVGRLTIDGTDYYALDKNLRRINNNRSTVEYLAPIVFTHPNGEYEPIIAHTLTGDEYIGEVFDIKHHFAYLNHIDVDLINLAVTDGKYDKRHLLTVNVAAQVPEFTVIVKCMIDGVVETKEYSYDVETSMGKLSLDVVLDVYPDAIHEYYEASIEMKSIFSGMNPDIEVDAEMEEGDIFVIWPVRRRLANILADQINTPYHWN